MSGGLAGYRPGGALPTITIAATATLTPTGDPNGNGETTHIYVTDSNGWNSENYGITLK